MLRFKKLCLICCLILLYINSAQLIANPEDFYYKTIITEQQLVHTITVNPDKYNIINTTAMAATGKNIDSLSHIAQKIGAVAAINGGFFREIEHGSFVPAGPLKTENMWHGIAYQSRAAIGWFKDTNEVLIDRLKTKTSVQIEDLILPVYYFNPPKNINNKARLYSNIYPNFTNLNSLDPKILIKQPNEGLAYIYQNYKLETYKSDVKLAKVIVNITPQLEPKDVNLWQKVDFITSGAPVLIKNYNAISNYSQEKISYDFVNGQHLRTAVCILENGFWKFVVTSSGMAIPTLTNIMQTLQCKDAINLDGGGSSSMYLSSKMRSTPEFQSLGNAITDVIAVVSK